MASIATTDRGDQVHALWRVFLHPLTIPLVVTMLAFVPTFCRASISWLNHLDYSHGFVVPLFAGWLLWRRRIDIQSTYVRRTTVSENLVGVIALALALLLVLCGTFARVISVEVIGFVVAAWGWTLVAGGIAMLKVTWPALVSLLFMIPVPGLLIDPLREQLQSISTSISIFLLQLFGIAAERAGSVIQLTTTEVGVAEACSGLRILVSLFAIIFAVAVIVKRPPVEKLLLGVTAIPIAILMNAVRIALVAAAVQYAPTWESSVHDLAGLSMILMAVGMIALQLRFTSSLFEEQPRRVGRSF